MKKTIEKRCGCCNNWVGFDMYNEEEYKALCEVIENYEVDLRWRHAAENKQNENYFMKKIKQAVNKNVLVFDDDAPPNLFTGRLIRLMANCIDENSILYKKGVLRTVYVPPSAGVDLVYEGTGDINAIRKDFLVYRGIEIVTNFRLDYLDSNKATDSLVSRNLVDYFDALGGSLAYSDQGLVIGVCDNGEPILGSF